MAERPIFLADDVSYQKKNIEFDFFSGFSITQKQKSINSLHQNFRKKFPQKKILEVSSKSPNLIGVQASAFNLMIHMNSGKEYSVEQIFQSSKVFKKMGSQLYMLDKLDSKEMKKRISEIQKHDKLVGFNCFGQNFNLEPKTFFYNWIYINTLNQNKKLAEEISKYDSFSDIEFNPNKSINCQAEACSIYVYLRRSGLLKKALEDKKKFFSIVYENLNKLEPNIISNKNKQLRLF